MQNSMRLLLIAERGKAILPRHNISNQTSERKRKLLTIMMNATIIKAKTMTKTNHNKMTKANATTMNDKDGKMNDKDEKVFLGNSYSPALEHTQTKLIFENNNILIYV
jgi:hypothetical protein